MIAVIAYNAAVTDITAHVTPTTAHISRSICSCVIVFAPSCLKTVRTDRPELDIRLRNHSRFVIFIGLRPTIRLGARGLRAFIHRQVRVRSTPLYVLTQPVAGIEPTPRALYHELYRQNRDCLCLGTSIPSFIRLCNLQPDVPNERTTTHDSGPDIIIIR